jgi:putative phosphoesterase
VGVALARIGLLSDSHGRAKTTQQAVDLLVSQGAELLIHLGDVGTMEVIDALIAVPPGRDAPLEAHLVFGNVDWDADNLTTYAQELGVHVDHPVGFLDFDGQTLAFLHGHDEQRIDQAMSCRPRWFCHGHSHRQLDENKGDTRIINPGALFRASRYTVALLDTRTNQLQFFSLSRA